MKMKKNKERKKTKIQRGWDFGNGKFRKKKNKETFGTKIGLSILRCEMSLYVHSSPQFPVNSVFQKKFLYL